MTSASYQNEIRINVNGAISSLDGTGGTGALSSNTSPFNYTRTLATNAVNIAGGSLTLGYWETLNTISGIDATMPVGTNVGTITINYTLPNIISWYTAATGGTAIGSGSPFNPIGVTGSGIANTNTAGTYTFYAGCSTTTTCRTPATITVQPDPTITGSTVTCNGGYTTLTATGGGTYLWSTGETTAAITKKIGTYTVSVTNGTCTKTTSVVVTNLDITPAIAGSTLTCNNGTTTLTASGGNTYAWNNGGTNATITPIAGVYTVTVTGASSCTNTASITVTNTTSPSGVSGVTTNSTCWAGVANNDAKITLSGFAATARYQYSVGATFSAGAATPASITTIPANGIIATTVTNPSTATQVYTVRLYHATNDNCYTDINVTLNRVDCTCTSNCGTIVYRKN